jgi:glycosyltransferase involved in cell wall biosynthesis
MALVTIGMPVRNERRFISQTIEDILNQTFDDFVLLISSNASEDGTYEIVQGYAQKDRRIRIFRHSRNVGSIENFRFVRDLADSPFFMWAAGHDRYDKTFLEKCVKKFQTADPDTVLVFPKIQLIHEDDSLGRVYSYEKFDTQGIDEAVKRYFQVSFNARDLKIIYGLWRTEIIKKIRLKNIIMPDVFAILQASILGKFARVEEVLFFLREPKKRISLIEGTKRVLMMEQGKDYKPSEFKNRTSFGDIALIISEIVKFLGENLKFILDVDKFGFRLNSKEKFLCILIAVLSFFVMRSISISIYSFEKLSVKIREKIFGAV